MIDVQRNNAVIIIVTVILILWIVVVVVVVVAVLFLAIGGCGKLFTFCILVYILKDILNDTRTANVFNWLSYPQLWIISLPIVKEDRP
jgi:hypothetical protein